ncbi:DmsC/YnfH family molybdoenzyme membrane anchor subunit [Shigella boydii]
MAAMIFTVFGQCVAGWFYRSGFLALLKRDLPAEAQQRVIACMFGSWVLMGIGFIASCSILVHQCGVLFNSPTGRGFSTQ